MSASIYGNAASGIGTAANNKANQSLYAQRYGLTNPGSGTNSLMSGYGVDQGTWTV